MKNIIIVILVLIIFVMGGFFIVKYTDNNKIDENNNQISNETNTENTQNVNSNGANTQNTENMNTNNEHNNSESNFKIIEIMEEDFKNNYEIEEQYEIINKEYFNIKKKDNNVVITLIESDRNNDLLNENKQVTYNKEYIINNVNAEDVAEIFCGGEGQDLVYPVVYLLLKDGTVKGIDIENGYKTGNFNAETISGLENIQKIEQTSVTHPNDSGYVAVVAVAKDGTAFEIRVIEK